MRGGGATEPWWGRKLGRQVGERAGDEGRAPEGSLPQLGHQRVKTWTVTVDAAAGDIHSRGKGREGRGREGGGVATEPQ